MIGDGRIHQFAIRSGERSEWVFAREHTDLHPFSFGGLEKLVRELEQSQVPVYFTIDLDCLDPSVFWGTGTPEAGGVSFMQLLNALRLVSRTRVVGCDVNELAPMLDASGSGLQSGAGTAAGPGKKESEISRLGRKELEL